MGLLCAAAGLDRAAFRFAAITLVIVLLIHRDRPAWVVGAHRFFEVSVGIVTGLVVTAVWREHSPEAVQKPDEPRK